MKGGETKAYRNSFIASTQGGTRSQSGWMEGFAMLIGFRRSFAGKEGSIFVDRRAVINISVTCHFKAKGVNKKSTEGTSTFGSCSMGQHAAKAGHVRSSVCMPRCRSMQAFHIEQLIDFSGQTHLTISPGSGKPCRMVFPRYYARNTQIIQSIADKRPPRGEAAHSATPPFGDCVGCGIKVSIAHQGASAELCTVLYSSVQCSTFLLYHIATAM